MQFSLGDPVQVRINIQKFLDKLNMAKIRESINMIAEHKDKIVDIDKDLLTELKSHRFGKSLNCDAFFTTLHSVTLAAKPADCTTAIVYAKSSNNE